MRDPRYNLNAISLWCVAIVMAGSFAMLPVHAQTGTDVASTLHNLTSTGPGVVKTTSTDNVCRFCHTPHQTRPTAPLWNRNDPGTQYQTYDSTTLKAVVGQPTGSSRLCLSCHDGTIALAQTYNAMNSPGTIYISSTDRGHLGTDLTDDHPISFTYDSALTLQTGQLHDPANLPAQLPLDHQQKLQCTTCHDAHDNTFGHFLRMDNTGSAMCLSCHNVPDWTQSVHANSTASLSASVRDSWDNLTVNTVKDAACESCHRPHNAGGRQRLRRHAAEENNCLNCHDGTVAQTNLVASMNMISSHDSRLYTGVHDPTENPTSMAAHVECTDCHNPHRVQSTADAPAPAVRSAMLGVSGKTASGIMVNPATYEYQVCYKCHSQNNFAQPVVNRFLGTDNIADEFNPTNQSFHPVQTQGRSTDVPSLKQAYNTSSIIRCTDCHGTDQPSAAAGPHGSSSKPMLKANYSTNTIVVESPAAYALCYQCHDRNSILNDESFKEHDEHIRGEDSSCSACHDSHGVTNYTHLINFDRNQVFPSPKAGTGPTFVDRGTRRGSCTLLCHGKDHRNKKY